MNNLHARFADYIKYSYQIHLTPEIAGEWEWVASISSDRINQNTFLFWLNEFRTPMEEIYTIKDSIISLDELEPR